MEKIIHNGPENVLIKTGKIVLRSENLLTLDTCTILQYLFFLSVKITLAMLPCQILQGYLKNSYFLYS